MPVALTGMFPLHAVSLHPNLSAIALLPRHPPLDLTSGAHNSLRNRLNYQYTARGRSSGSRGGTSMFRFIASAVAIALASLASAQALTTAFTFQGELDNAGSPVTGTYDLRFTLFDTLSGGAQRASTLCSDNVAIAGGRFTVQLDFGVQFTGNQRFLEVQIRQDTGLSCAAYHRLHHARTAPRLDRRVPNAVYSLNAGMLPPPPPTPRSSAASPLLLHQRRQSLRYAPRRPSLHQRRHPRRHGGLLRQPSPSPPPPTSTTSQTLTSAAAPSPSKIGTAAWSPPWTLTGTSGNIGILRVRNRIENVAQRRGHHRRQLTSGTPPAPPISPSTAPPATARSTANSRASASHSTLPVPTAAPSPMD